MDYIDKTTSFRNLNGGTTLMIVTFRVDNFNVKLWSRLVRNDQGYPAWEQCSSRTKAEQDSCLEDDGTAPDNALFTLEPVLRTNDTSYTALWQVGDGDQRRYLACYLNNNLFSTGNCIFVSWDSNAEPSLNPPPRLWSNGYVPGRSNWLNGWFSFNNAAQEDPPAPNYNGMYVGQVSPNVNFPTLPDMYTGYYIYQDGNWFGNVYSVRSLSAPYWGSAIGAFVL